MGQGCLHSAAGDGIRWCYPMAVLAVLGKTRLVKCECLV